MKHLIKYYLIILCVFLSACNNDESKVIEVDNPEKVTIAFFHALYNEKDIKKAASVCSPQLARIILHYKSPKAVARHMFNMSYDKVEIKPDGSGVKVREQFKGAAEITVYLDGYYNEDRIKDVKKISLIQKKGKWVIDKILKDPF